MNNQIQIDGEFGIVKSNNGEIEFTIEDDGISILGISVAKKRKGIGSTLEKKLEEFCLRQDIRRITVPSTPSKEALSFWLSRGYDYVYSEDKDIETMILSNKKSDKIIETYCGIILLEKIVGENRDGSG